MKIAKINVKTLSEANRHCRDNNCDGCPHKNKKMCDEREQMNTETIIEFLGMIGYNPNVK